MPKAFATSEKKKEDIILLRGNNFLQQLRRSGVSQVCGEKVAAARTDNTHRMTAIPLWKAKSSKVVLNCLWIELI